MTDDIPEQMKGPHNAAMLIRSLASEVIEHIDKMYPKSDSSPLCFLQTFAEIERCARLSKTLILMHHERLASSEGLG